MKGCKALSDDEIQAIQAKLKNPRDLALFALGLKSGFRISELLSIKVSDVYQFGAVVKEVSVARCYMKKKVEGRTVPLHNVAREALQVLIETENLEPYHFLFKSQKHANKAISASQAWRIIVGAAREAQITGKIGTHCLRKSFGMRVYQKLGKDLLRTQAAMGHRSISSTVAYLSFAQQEVTDAILSI